MLLDRRDADLDRLVEESNRTLRLGSSTDRRPTTSPARICATSTTITIPVPITTTPGDTGEGCGGSRYSTIHVGSPQAATVGRQRDERELQRLRAYGLSGGPARRWSATRCLSGSQRAAEGRASDGVRLSRCRFESARRGSNRTTDGLRYFTDRIAATAPACKSGARTDNTYSGLVIARRRQPAVTWTYRWWTHPKSHGPV